MDEKVLRFSFYEPLSKKVLEEIIQEFDYSHSPVISSELNKNPSELAYKTPEMIFIAGLSNTNSSQAEVIRYPPSIEYIETKGNSIRTLIEEKLNQYKIKYDSHLK